MGNFDKKDIVKKAEKIIEDFSKKDREERKETLKLKKEYKKLRKTNIGLRVIIGIMAVVLTLVIL